MDGLPKGFIKEKTICVDWFNLSNIIKIGMLDEKCIAIKQGPNLKREIEILKKIGSHPNIVEFISSVDDGFIMTGIKDGYTLHDYCVEGRTRNSQQEGKPFSIQICVNMINQLSQALKHLHSMNIIHHDLKDKNVLVDETENSDISSYHLKLCDFEFAEVTDEHGHGSEEHRMSGTAHWRAPEQENNIDQLPVTNKIDIYAFGSLCVEILTFNRTTKELYDECPAIIYDVAFLCQSKNPNDRLAINDVSQIFEILDKEGTLEQLKGFNMTVKWDRNK
jgi:serine/threonine protein kinase